VDGVISQFILFLILKLGLFVLNNLLNYLFLEGKRFVNRLLASFFHSSRSIALLLAHRIDLLVNERVLSICGAFLEILLRLSSFLVIIDVNLIQIIFIAETIILSLRLFDRLLIQLLIVWLLVNAVKVDQFYFLTIFLLLTLRIIGVLLLMRLLDLRHVVV